MRTTFGGLLLLFGLAACAGRSEETSDEATRVATDTIIETRVADTMLVTTDTSVSVDTTIAADTAIVADTAIAVDTSITADTTVHADTTKLD